MCVLLKVVLSSDRKLILWVLVNDPQEKETESVKQVAQNKGTPLSCGHTGSQSSLPRCADHSRSLRYSPPVPQTLVQFISSLWEMFCGLVLNYKVQGEAHVAFVSARFCLREIYFSPYLCDAKAATRPRLICRFILVLFRLFDFRTTKRWNPHIVDAGTNVFVLFDESKNDAEQFTLKSEINLSPCVIYLSALFRFEFLSF